MSLPDPAMFTKRVKIHFDLNLNVHKKATEKLSAPAKIGLVLKNTRSTNLVLAPHHPCSFIYRLILTRILTA